MGMLVSEVQDRLAALADALGPDVLSLSTGVMRTEKGLIEVDSQGCLFLTLWDEGDPGHLIGVLSDPPSGIVNQYFLA